MSACVITPELQPALTDQLHRIVSSDLMKGSDTLRRILLYLGDCAIHSPGVAAREHTIAIQVLGRSQAFDPRADSCVRVHVGRLRSRLVRYYAGPGAHDPLVISIPLGTYLLVVQHATPPMPVAPPIPVLVPRARTRPWWREPVIQYAVIAVLCLVLGTLIGIIVTQIARPAAGLLSH